MLINKRCKILHIHFFVSFTSQHAFTLTYCYHHVGNFSFRCSFFPLASTLVWDLRIFFSILSLWELTLDPCGSSCKRRRLHPNKTQQFRSKQLAGNFLASFEQIRLFSLCLLHSSVLFCEPAGRSTPLCSTIIGQFNQWHGEFLPSPSDAAK